MQNFKQIQNTNCLHWIYLLLILHIIHNMGQRRKIWLMTTKFIVVMFGYRTYIKYPDASFRLLGYKTSPDYCKIMQNIHIRIPSREVFRTCASKKLQLTKHMIDGAHKWSVQESQYTIMYSFLAKCMLPEVQLYSLKP